MLVPTRVGMIPPSLATLNRVRACPHTRGDDPKFFNLFFA